jgi:hypothetical protein
MAWQGAKATEKRRPRCRVRRVGGRGRDAGGAGDGWRLSHGSAPAARVVGGDAVYSCVEPCTAGMLDAVCAAVHDCTRLYTALHGCTRLYTAVHGFTRLYTAVHGCTRLCTAVHGCTRLYTGAACGGPHRAAASDRRRTRWSPWSPWSPWAPWASWAAKASGHGASRASLVSRIQWHSLPYCRPATRGRWGALQAPPRTVNPAERPTAGHGSERTAPSKWR